MYSIHTRSNRLHSKYLQNLCHDQNSYVTCTTLNKNTETSPPEIKSAHLKQRQDFRTMLEMALRHHSELSFTGWAFVCNHVQSKQFSYFKNVSHGGRKGYWSPLVVTFALTFLFSVCLSIWILTQVSSCTITFILIQGILVFISNEHYVGERLRTVMTQPCACISSYYSTSLIEGV